MTSGWTPPADPQHASPFPPQRPHSTNTGAFPLGRAAAVPVKSAKTGGRGPWWVALLLALVLAAGTGWYFWRGPGSPSPDAKGSARSSAPGSEKSRAAGGDTYGIESQTFPDAAAGQAAAAVLDSLATRDYESGAALTCAASRKSAAEVEAAAAADKAKTTPTPAYRLIGVIENAPDFYTLTIETTTPGEPASSVNVSLRRNTAGLWLVCPQPLGAEDG